MVAKGDGDVGTGWIVEMEDGWDVGTLGCGNGDGGREAKALRCRRWDRRWEMTDRGRECGMDVRCQDGCPKRLDDGLVVVAGGREDRVGLGDSRRWGSGVWWSDAPG